MTTHIPPDLRAEFEERFGMTIKQTSGIRTSYPNLRGTALEKDLLSFFAEREEKAREEAFIEGQKHAFGVDKERVAREARAEERERVLIVVNEVAHKEAKKWEHERIWTQPYAGNRLSGLVFVVREALTPTSNQKEK